MDGTLALVGGREFTEGCTFDVELVGGVPEVLLIPAALAYENPRAVIEAAVEWFTPMGVTVRTLEVLPPRRRHGSGGGPAGRGGPSRLPDRRLADAPAFGAQGHAAARRARSQTWRGGATIVAAGEAASVLCSHMVDSRGGAFTVGLDLITTMTIVPRHNQWSPEKFHRTVELAPRGLPLVGIDEATALIRSPDGAWRVEGTGHVHVYLDGSRADLGCCRRELNVALGQGPT